MKKPKKPKVIKEFTNLSVLENSLVDKPACQYATIDFIKSGSQNEEENEMSQNEGLISTIKSVLQEHTNLVKSKEEQEALIAKAEQAKIEAEAKEAEVAKKLEELATKEAEIAKAEAEMALEKRMDELLSDIPCDDVEAKKAFVKAYEASENKAVFDILLTHHNQNIEKALEEVGTSEEATEDVVTFESLQKKFIDEGLSAGKAGLKARTELKKHLEGIQ